jgi:hypothetical protein
MRKAVVNGEAKHFDEKDLALLVIAGLLVFLDLLHAQQEQRGQTSYMKVDSTESFASFKARVTAEKPGIEKEHNALLNERYDLSDRPALGITMDRGKPIQQGVRVKLAAGMTWEKLAAMSAEQIREQNLYAKGFYPLMFLVNTCRCVRRPAIG